jgi:hypothetical protein
MRIEWTPSLRPATQRRDDRSTVAGRTFSLSQSGETAATAGPQATPVTDAVTGLFSLQEVEDELSGRRRAMARGDSLLDALDGLRLALLDGAMPRAQLAALGQLAQQHAALVDDPRLAAILAEIELRAAVELAKLERDQND